MGLFKTTGVSKFKILVDLPGNGQPFKRGDLVKGNVYLQCATSIKYRLVSIQLLGKAFYSGTDPYVVDKVVDYISYLKTPAGAGGQVAAAVEAAAAVNSNPLASNGPSSSSSPKPEASFQSVGCLSEGEYHFPFSIKLPENALPSVDVGMVRVEYKLIASILREGSVFNNSEEQEIFVAAAMSREQFDIEASAPQQLRNAVVPMRNGILSNNGCIEVAASLSGTVLVTSKPTERIQIAVELDAAGGKKPITWVKVELQMMIQADYQLSQTLTAYYGLNQMKPGDLHSKGGKELKPWTEPHVMSDASVIAQGTNSPGYVEGQGSNPGYTICQFNNSMWKADLRSDTSGVAVGGKGRFTGSILLDTSDSSGKSVIPTVRGEHLQVNWRVAIKVDNCSRQLYMPIVVVDSIVDPTTATSSATSTASPHLTALPWFHHEKYMFSMKQGQQYEVPALGTVVRDTERQQALSTSTTTANGGASQSSSNNNGMHPNSDRPTPTPSPPTENYGNGGHHLGYGGDNYEEEFFQ